MGKGGGKEIKKKQILDLFQPNQTISVEQIMERLAVSERQARELIWQLRQDGTRHGFSVVTRRNQGYALRVEQQDAYEGYLAAVKERGQDVSGKRSRIPLILYFLFQQDDYITLQRIAELIDVSRTTILGDLPELKRILAGYELALVSKAHYGIRIAGGEADFRRAFYRFVVESPEYTAMAQDYTDFARKLDLKGIKEVFQEPEDISTSAMESILDHIRVLIYRVCRQNFIADLRFDPNKLVERYEEVANRIILQIQQTCGVELPQTEQKYLAAQIAAKASVQDVPKEERLLIREKIHTILCGIDALFQTAFAEDERLEDALLLHIYPMLVRVSYNMELSNPLVDMVSTQYANVFLIALRFAQMWEDDGLEGLPSRAGLLSRDEIGYLALHFASHLEQRKQQQLNKIRRILLITGERRSNLHLMKSRLEQEFPGAIVGVVHPLKVTETHLREADLLLSTCHDPAQSSDFQVLKVNLLAGGEELHRLREQLLVSPQGVVKSGDFSLKQLFFEDLFLRCEDGDYVAALCQMSETMERSGYAEEGFARLVMQREERFSTVYENGIAGPHAMEHAAKVNSIGVVLFPKGAASGGKKATVMFLINVKKGHLFVHQEISAMLVKLMEQRELIRRLQRAENFTQFMDLLWPLLS